MLNRPKLPPKAGYVEQIINGEHVYVPTEETLRFQTMEEALAQTDEIAIELFEAQITQDEINEAQEQVNAAQDEALIEIYEMIGG